MGPRRRARRRGMVAGAVVGSAVSRNKGSDDAPAQPAPAAQSDMASQLQELQALKDQNILTQEEFDAKKKQILGL